MFSSDSETECNVEKFSSEKSLPDEFDTVPSNKEFKLKFSAGGKTQLRIQSYILKEGKLLPYVVNMKGTYQFKQILFFPNARFFIKFCSSSVGNFEKTKTL